jgi:hypothetical protein
MEQPEFALCLFSVLTLALKVTEPVANLKGNSLSIILPLGSACNFLAACWLSCGCY